MRSIFFIDPSVLSSAQQKVMNFHSRRVITNPRVAKAMRMVSELAKPSAGKAMEATRGGATSISLSVRFLFPFPKRMTKKEREDAYDGKPVVSARYGDLDNRVKAFIDALVDAGWFKDDRYITSLHVSKVYTTASPRIVVDVKCDEGYIPDDVEILRAR